MLSLLVILNFTSARQIETITLQNHKNSKNCRINNLQFPQTRDLSEKIKVAENNDCINVKEMFVHLRFYKTIPLLCTECRGNYENQS